MPVDESLKNNDATIVSIFVNPAQFAPHEDLSTYPRTLESDLSSLSTCSYTSPSSSTPRKVSALFLPPVEALYPSGITTEVSKQRGTFIEVKGLQDSMEGKSRPGFFRGVATVVLKLFNLVQVRFLSHYHTLLFSQTDQLSKSIPANARLLWSKRYPTSFTPPTTLSRPSCPSTTSSKLDHLSNLSGSENPPSFIK